MPSRVNRAFKYFKFGNDIVRWIDVFYKDISSCVINNGHASPFFVISRAVRQGFPISPYHFVICMELLATSTRNDSSQRGILIIDTDVNTEVKLSLYADETTLLLPGNETALRRALQIFDKFRVCSGLQLNFSKCKLLRISALKNQNFMFYSDYDLHWTNQTVSAFGVVFSINTEYIICLNYEPQLIGKITITKTLAVSKLVFLFTSLPNPKDAFFLQLKRVIVNFFFWI